MCVRPSQPFSLNVDHFYSFLNVLCHIQGVVLKNTAGESGAFFPSPLVRVFLCIFLGSRPCALGSLTQCIETKRGKAVLFWIDGWEELKGPLPVLRGPSAQAVCVCSCPVFCKRYFSFRFSSKHAQCGPHL